MPVSNYVYISISDYYELMPLIFKSYFGILYTYEINNESFTFCDDLIAHVKEQKKNFMHATPFTLFKAVKVFGEKSSKCMIRRSRKRVWVFSNLKRKLWM